ncbi:MAG: hypothetical protein ACD_79C01412G0002 [uncultured bacterium]|nr:MAG: hypothetical protein ACD_79C01412G0002 [uncultured bacterium]
MANDTSDSQSFIGLAVRLYWFIIGHIVLLFNAISIFENKPSLNKNLLFIFLLGFLILMKFLDIRYFKGKDSEGAKPATMDDFKKFLTRTSMGYGIILIILNVFVK